MFPRYRCNPAREKASLFPFLSLRGEEKRYNPSVVPSAESAGRNGYGQLWVRVSWMKLPAAVQSGNLYEEIPHYLATRVPSPPLSSDIISTRRGNFFEPVDARVPRAASSAASQQGTSEEINYLPVRFVILNILFCRTSSRERPSRGETFRNRKWLVSGLKIENGRSAVGFHRSVLLSQVFGPCLRLSARLCFTVRR